MISDESVEETKRVCELLRAENEAETALGLSDQQLARRYATEHDAYHDSDGVDVEAVFIAGVKAQRERDAALCESMGKFVKGGYNNAAHEIANAIRYGVKK